MLRLQITIAFMFYYDGTSPSIDIDTRRGAVTYPSGLPPLFFQEIAAGVIDVSVNGVSPSGASIGWKGPATLSNKGILTIALTTASGGPALIAGTLTGGATLVYDVN
jgi:hypothetical protein